jgi:hypothetical protein
MLPFVITAAASCAVTAFFAVAVSIFLAIYRRPGGTIFGGAMGFGAGFAMVGGLLFGPSAFVGSLLAMAGVALWMLYIMRAPNNPNQR